MKPAIRIGFVLAAFAAAAFAQQPQTPPTPDKTVVNMFHYINDKILEMARDFPEDKYSFKARPEMRSFGEVIVHIASGNAFAARRAAGDASAKWDEIDPKGYKDKAAIVAMMQKSVDDANATLKTWTPETFHKTVHPCTSVIQHSSEHYGLLVAYYRLNGLVPPESRPKK